jgi:hypothetical protein
VSEKDLEQKIKSCSLSLSLSKLNISKLNKKAKLRLKKQSQLQMSENVRELLLVFDLNGTLLSRVKGRAVLEAVTADFGVLGCK